MPPKYAEIVSALQSRIDGEFYAVGALLPSEAQLTREFRTSRSTVVRALRYLRRQGWVRGVQGKGRIVLGRPATTLATLPHRVRFLLQADRHAVPLGIRCVLAPARIAAALDRPAGAPLFAARYLLAPTGPTSAAPPFGLSTVFVPAALTDAATAEPDGGLLTHVERRNGTSAHRVVERLGARMATDAEMSALSLRQRRSVAVSLITVLDVADVPFLAVDAVLSREAPDLVATYDL
ncbi:GntR family transcriptional regulator [Dactylosporangium sp. NPDC048998]|uniref:GntR family transcriptional regulator n=1 Tax=Dactylosporangium sp. NPDC048998 TaxID=3363976 RepID=UPI00371A6A18